MDAKIEVATAYRAYAQILSAGEQVASDPHHRDGRRLDGLTAYTDHDGYGVTLTNGTASARLLFHSKIEFDAPSSSALQLLSQQIASTAAR